MKLKKFLLRICHYRKSLTTLFSVQLFLRKEVIFISEEQTGGKWKLAVVKIAREFECVCVCERERERIKARSSVLRVQELNK